MGSRIGGLWVPQRAEESQSEGAATSRVQASLGGRYGECPVFLWDILRTIALVQYIAKIPGANSVSESAVLLGLLGSCCGPILSCLLLYFDKENEQINLATKKDGVAWERCSSQSSQFWWSTRGLRAWVAALDRALAISWWQVSLIIFNPKLWKSCWWKVQIGRNYNRFDWIYNWELCWSSFCPAYAV